ncbi:MAG: hypothetical protein R8K20_11690 [Gallionellaceae bacterium]
MQTINDLLDLAKENSDVKSDRQLALMIGISNAAPYRTKGVVPNDKTAILLAKLCNMKPEVVIAICHSVKAETKEEKNVWQHFYKMAATAAIAGVIVSGGVSGAHAQGVQSESPSISQTAHYEVRPMDIMLSYAHNLLDSVRAWCNRLADIVTTPQKPMAFC